MQRTTDPRAAHRAGDRPTDGARSTAVRAAVFALVGAVLGVCGHHLASGTPVPWRAALFATGVLFAAAVPVARTRCSLPVVTAATVAAQAGLHLWLGAAGQAAGHSGHVHHHSGHVGGHGTMAAAPHQGWHAAQHSGWAMTAAHLAAALVVAWCLHQADAACRRAGRVAIIVGRTLRSGLGALLAWLLLRARQGRRTAPGALLPTRPPEQPASPRTPVLLADAVVRRGPPPQAVPASPYDLGALPRVPGPAVISWGVTHVPHHCRAHRASPRRRHGRCPDQRPRGRRPGLRPRRSHR